MWKKLIQATAITSALYLVMGMSNPPLGGSATHGSAAQFHRFIKDRSCFLSHRCFLGNHSIRLSRSQIHSIRSKCDLSSYLKLPVEFLAFTSA